MTRRLVYGIPIVHNAADLGSLASDAQRASNARDANAWKQKQAAITRFWDSVARWCLTLPKDLSTFRLYQDGLPVCGREKEIVADLASSGSRNHEIIQSLMNRGAIIEGTESPELLLEEYRLAQSLLRPVNTSSHETSPIQVPTPQRSAAELLHARDHFIAQRIASTLKQGETGILFVGGLHDVLSKLPSTFDVQRVTRLA